MPLRAYLVGGHASRLMKPMEMHVKNVPKHYKEPLVPEPKDAIEREERLATVWTAFIFDAGFSVNSCWGQSMDLEDVRCNFPTSTDEFRKKARGSDWSTWRKLTRAERAYAGQPPICGVSGFVHEACLLIRIEVATYDSFSHPFPEPFVLVVKASIILSRAAKYGISPVTIA